MQADLAWYNEDDPETIELSVGIDGRVRTHEVPVPFLDQEFESDEERRHWIERQLGEMALYASVDWRDQQ